MSFLLSLSAIAAVLWILWRIAKSSVVLHMMYEVGAPPEKRYKAASTIFQNALKNRSQRELHWALDVVLCEGKIDEIPFGSSFHQRYWELGHRISVEILKYQDVLNIHQYWFCQDYLSAKQMMEGEYRRSGRAS